VILDIQIHWLSIGYGARKRLNKVMYVHSLGGQERWGSRERVFLSRVP
jgi:hypothetical protein